MPATITVRYPQNITLMGADATSRCGRVMGLAQAAQESTARVIKMVDDDEVARLLREMQQEAAETEKRAGRRGRRKARDPKVRS